MKKGAIDLAAGSWELQAWQLAAGSGNPAPRPLPQAAHNIGPDQAPAQVM